jgi:hypothetical protein
MLAHQPGMVQFNCGNGSQVSKAGGTLLLGRGLVEAQQPALGRGQALLVIIRVIITAPLLAIESGRLVREVVL